MHCQTKACNGYEIVFVLLVLGEQLRESNRRDQKQAETHKNPQQAIEMQGQVARGAAALDLDDGVVAQQRDERAARAANIIALNAGAAIYVAGLAESLAAGVQRAREVMDQGQAQARLERLVQLSQVL